MTQRLRSRAVTGLPRNNNKKTYDKSIFATLFNILPTRQWKGSQNIKITPCKLYQSLTHHPT